MELIELIIKIGAIAGALAAIWKIAKPIRNKISHFFQLIDEMLLDVKELKKHSLENYLGIKRLTVMSHDMPIGERIIAGKEYIEAGGNGDLKKYIVKELHVQDVQKE